MTDLANRADVEVLLRRFYGRVFADDTLEEPFSELREKGLESHLPVMCDFWETVLFRAGLYRGNAFQVHRQLNDRHPLGANHFGRWLTLWEATVDEMYQGPAAERAKLQAARIAKSMHRRLNLSPTGEFAEDAHPVGPRLNHDQAQCDDRVEVGGTVSGEDPHGRVGSRPLAHAENNAIVPGCVEAQTQRTEPASTQAVLLPEQRESVLATLTHRLAANGEQRCPLVEVDQQARLVADEVRPAQHGLPSATALDGEGRRDVIVGVE
jgi:hemoglobin